MFSDILKIDPEIAAAIDLEVDRQERKIELIASENFVSKAVMKAMATPLTNKYAEGYPGKRYYGGCEHVDLIETLAIERAKKIFGAEHANVQPHSGAQANTTVYFSILRPGDTIMGMNLSHGGHLTHGSPVSISGSYFNAIHYGVRREDGYIDYDEILNLALKNRPKLIVAGASAYPRIIDFQKFRDIANEVEAYLMVDMAHIAGLVAVGLHPSPIPYADFITSTTHKTLRGPRGGMILCKNQYAKIIDKALFPGIQGGPLMHIIAAKAICFKEALMESFKKYQEQVIKNAERLASTLILRGYDLVSGGTDNHLMLVDLRSKGLTGKEAERRLDAVGITVNKNTVPYDEQSPFITSGIRLGTPAMTSRGMMEEDMEIIGRLIDYTLVNGISNKVKEQIHSLCQKYPMSGVDGDRSQYDDCGAVV